MVFITPDFEAFKGLGDVKRGVRLVILSLDKA